MVPILLWLRKIVIQGDFNDEEVEVEGFREITHKKLYHKHNESTNKKRIDKVFVNFPDVGILEVKPTVENIRKDKEEESELGHKMVVLWVGNKPVELNRGTQRGTQAFGKKKEKMLSFKKLKRIVRGEANMKLMELDEERIKSDEVYLKEVVKDMTKAMRECVGKSKVLVGRKSNRRRVLIKHLE